MVSKKFANLCKFGKYCRWPAQDCLNWSAHCNLLFLHESMLWINQCKSTLWLNVCAKVWITFNVQNTSKSGWKSTSFFIQKVFLPLRLGKTILVFFYYNFSLIKYNKKFQCHNILWYVGYLLSKDLENTLVCFRDIANLKFVFLPHLTNNNLTSTHAIDVCNTSSESSYWGDFSLKIFSFLL